MPMDFGDPLLLNHGPPAPWSLLHWRCGPFKFPPKNDPRNPPSQSSTVSRRPFDDKARMQLMLFYPSLLLLRAFLSLKHDMFLQPYCNACVICQCLVSASFRFPVNVIDSR